MGSSIHINGTGSSIVDTIFVCRTQGTVSRKIRRSREKKLRAWRRLTWGSALTAAKLHATQSDIRCMAYGHLIHMAMWTLKERWNRSLTTTKKLAVVAAIEKLGGWPAIEWCLADKTPTAPTLQRWAVAEGQVEYEVTSDAVLA